MQETCNNCFGSKKRSTTLLQTKTGKHKCRNVGCCYILALVLTCFCLKKGHATFFRPETIVASLASDSVIFQSVMKPFFKMPVFGAQLTSKSLKFTDLTVGVKIC